MRLGSLAATTGLAIGLAVSPASALTINYNVISGDTVSGQQMSALQAAAALWSAVITNNVTLNVNVGFEDLGATGILATTTPSEYTEGYSGLKAALTTHATSADDATALANLPATVLNNNVVLTQANLVALGLLASGGNAGKMVFNTEVSNFQYSRAADGSVSASSYDFLGVAVHELGHILGFESDVGTGLVYQAMLDLFRYSSPGTLSFTNCQAAYFSINGGATAGPSFSTGIASGNPACDGNQTSHWAENTDLMQPVLPLGTTQNITAADIQAFDVIGWDVAAAEPGSLALLGSMLTGLVAIRRRTTPRTRRA